MEFEIPDNEKENVLSVYWQMLVEIETRTRPQEDPIGALLVSQAYDLLNRIGATNARPRWEEK